MTTPIGFESYLCNRNDTIDNTIYDLARLIYGEVAPDYALRDRALSIVTAMAADPDSAKPSDGLLDVIIAKATKIIGDVREDIAPKDDETQDPEWDMCYIGEIADYVEGLINFCGILACRPYYEDNEGTAKTDEYDEGEGVNKNADVPCYLGHDCKVADCPVRKAWGLPQPQANLDQTASTDEDACKKAPAKNEIRVETPAGTLLARACNDPEYPGIDIVLVNKDGTETNLALVEHIPGGESYTGENHVIGDIIPEARTEYHDVELWSGQRHAFPVLTEGLVARVWNDGDRDDPVSIAYVNLEYSKTTQKQTLLEQKEALRKEFNEKMHALDKKIAALDVPKEETV